MIQSLRKTFLWFLLGIIFVLPAAGEISVLKNHPSPYLGMHAHDPVEWNLWGKDVFARARAENKLVFVSIGYFSCHWCHVMQKESYQNSAIAEQLNKHFISVKVDRELRPELDRRLLRFVEEVRGQAGWPLNVFITPEGYPVTGFTYLPPDSFLQALGQLNTMWSERHASISQAAQAYFKQTESSEMRSTLVDLPQANSGLVLDTFVSQAIQISDQLLGGFGNTMKFPSYPQLNTLLTAICSNPGMDKEVSEFVRLTLDSMAEFHLMDQLNGGFFRYTTDPDWQTPHFEKMLYDNAQLAALYLDAESLWPGQGYAQVGLNTIDFMLEYLADESGGFAASLSAVDTSNVEGGAYFWTINELKAVLTDKEFSYLQHRWDLAELKTEAFLLKPLTGIREQNDGVLEQNIRNKLRKVTRPVMPLDSKKLASWNGLALAALVKAQKYRSTPELKAQTTRLFKFIKNNFINGKQVIRFAGQALAADTTLEDYAELAYAIQLYALLTDDKEAQVLVDNLVKEAFSRFYRDGRWFREEASLIPGDNGELVIQDGVLPSASSRLLKTVLLMKKPDRDILQKTRAIVPRLTRDLTATPYYYGSNIALNQDFGACIEKQLDRGGLKNEVEAGLKDTGKGN
jgi:hypothetical protein